MSSPIFAVPPPTKTAPLFLGIDVGGTNIKLGLIDDAGGVVAQSSVATHQERGVNDAIGRVTVALKQLVAVTGRDWADVVAAGLATPGPMDIPAGLILTPGNLPAWRNFPIVQAMSLSLGMPVTYANDANAAAFGEYWVGSGGQYHSIVLLTLGTGLGGGIIIGDLSIDGENSHGSECGHIVIDMRDDARICGCGSPGCLEAYASATALIKIAEEGLESGRKSAVGVRVGAGEELTPLLIAEEAEQGDAWAMQLVMDTARYLGVGVVSFMHTIDPGAVILGGAMNFGGPGHPLGEKFIEHVREEVRRRAFPVVANKTPIEFALLGGDAGFIGAAGLARAAYHKGMTN